MSQCSFCEKIGLYTWAYKFACKAHYPILQKTTASDNLARCAKSDAAASNRQEMKDVAALMNIGGTPVKCSALKIIAMCSHDRTDRHEKKFNRAKAEGK